MIEIFKEHRFIIDWYIQWLRTDWSIQYYTILILQLYSNTTTNWLIEGVVGKLIVVIIVAPIVPVAPVLGGVPVVSVGVVLRVSCVTIIEAGSPDGFLLGRDLPIRWKVVGWWGGVVVVVAAHSSLIRCRCGLLRSLVAYSMSLWTPPLPPFLLVDRWHACTGSPWKPLDSSIAWSLVETPLRLWKVSAFQFIWSHGRPFQGVHATSR
jgi:hypothetical protein